MHVPDGFLDAKTIITSTIISSVGLGVAIQHLKRSFPARRIPMLGLCAAFIFAAQMLNFPVAGGTSGHLIGGVLASVLLGPSASILVLSSVLILQCLLFADGGITTLGANILVLGLVAPCSGYALYRLILSLNSNSLRQKLFATAISAWASTVISSIVCTGLLAFSSTVVWNIGFPAMTGTHMLIGLGEAVITTFVVAGVSKSYPEFMIGSSERVEKPLPLITYGMIISLSLVFFVAPFACPWPDGLEKVAGTLGFEHLAKTSALPSFLSDYTIPGLKSPFLSTAFAGTIGTLLIFVLAYLLARGLTRPSTKQVTSP